MGGRGRSWFWLALMEHCCPIPDQSLGHICRMILTRQDIDSESRVCLNGGMTTNLELSGWYATFETRLTSPDPLTGATGWQDSTRDEILRFCQRRGWRLDAMLDITEGGADGCALVTIDEGTYQRLLDSGSITDELVSDDLHCLVSIERPDDV